MFGLINRSVAIRDLGITDNQLYDRLIAKGLRKRNIKERNGDFSYKCQDYLVYYQKISKTIQFLIRNPQTGDFTEFARFYYENGGLGVVESTLVHSFMLWLNSPEKATPFTPMKR